MKNILVIFICLAAFSSGYAEDECCKTKSVGGVDYTLAQWDPDQVDPSCLNGCIYRKDGDDSTLFCFASGDLPVVCTDEEPFCSCDYVEEFEGCKINPDYINLPEGEGCCCYTSILENFPPACIGIAAGSDTCFLNDTLQCPANCTTKACCEATGCEPPQNCLGYGYGTEQSTTTDEAPFCSCDYVPADEVESGGCIISPDYINLPEGEGCCCSMSDAEIIPPVCYGYPAGYNTCYLSYDDGEGIPCPANCATEACCEATNCTDVLDMAMGNCAGYGYGTEQTTTTLVFTEQTTTIPPTTTT